MNKPEVAFFWFRRDLRLEDNVGLFYALESKYPVIPLFIFDEAILDSLPKNDARVGFIHDSLSNINRKLQELGSSLLVKTGKTNAIWQALLKEFDVSGKMGGFLFGRRKALCFVTREFGRDADLFETILFVVDP